MKEETVSAVPANAMGDASPTNDAGIATFSPLLSRQVQKRKLSSIVGELPSLKVLKGKKK